jgi:hypothetical protein
MSRSERFFDLLIRLLMAATGAVLVVCVAFLIYRWVNPPATPNHDIQLTEVPVKSTDSLQRAESPISADAQVLLAPGQIFKCVVNGHVTFSDRGCAKGATEAERH